MNGWMDGWIERTIVHNEIVIFPIRTRDCEFEYGIKMQKKTSPSFYSQILCLYKYKNTNVIQTF